MIGQNKWDLKHWLCIPISPFHIKDALDQHLWFSLIFSPLNSPGQLPMDMLPLSFSANLLVLSLEQDNEWIRKTEANMWVDISCQSFDSGSFQNRNIHYIFMPFKMQRIAELPKQDNIAPPWVVVGTNLKVACRNQSRDAFFIISPAP